MHCPRCGTIASDGSGYCRACGLNLGKVSELLGGAAQAEVRTTDIARLKDQQRKHQNLGEIAGLMTFALILLLFIFIVVTQMIMKGGILIVLGSLLVLLAIGAGVMVYFQASAKSLKQKLSEPQLPRATAPLSIDALTSHCSGSITDRTTELLTEQRDRSTRDVTSQPCE